MAKRKKIDPNQQSLRIGLNDERLPKLLGVLLIFFAVYLFLAFTSYLFTWRIDQDRVLRFSWTLLEFSDLTVDNWLGRFGAFMASFFYYYGFGLASFVVPYYLFRLGLNRLRRQQLRPMGKLLARLGIVMVFGAVLLEFVLGWMEFPVGGGVGELLREYLGKVMGNVGIVLLLLALAGLYFVFVARIDFTGNRREIQTAMLDHLGERLRFRRVAARARLSPTSRSERGQ